MAAFPEAIYQCEFGTVQLDPSSANDPGIPASCPFGVIYWNEDMGIAQKCTFCAHLLVEGKSPECVSSCPQIAMTFGDLDDPGSEASRLIAERKAKNTYPLAHGSVSKLARPNVYYITTELVPVVGKLACLREKAPIEGATVTATDLRTGNTMEATSAEDGWFRVSGLVTGNAYMLTIESPYHYARKRFVYATRRKELGKVTLYPR
jgi:ferredoxin